MDLPTRCQPSILSLLRKIQFPVLLYSLNCFNNWKRTVWRGLSEGRSFSFLTGHMSIGKSPPKAYTCLGSFNWKYMALQEKTPVRGQKWCKRSPSLRGKDHGERGRRGNVLGPLWVHRFYCALASLITPWIIYSCCQKPFPLVN